MTKLGTILLGTTFLALAILAVPAPSLSATLASTAPSLCVANSSTAELPPFLNPALSKSLGPIQGRPCGACSNTLCQGLREFDVCGYDATGRVYRCSEFAISCPGDTRLQCSCVKNPS